MLCFDPPLVIYLTTTFGIEWCFMKKYNDFISHLCRFNTLFIFNHCFYLGLDFQLIVADNSLSTSIDPNTSSCTSIDCTSCLALLARSRCFSISDSNPASSIENPCSATYSSVNSLGKP